MWERRRISYIFVALSLLASSPVSLAQSGIVSNSSDTKLDKLVRQLLGKQNLIQTPIDLTHQSNGLPVRLKYDGPKVEGKLTLEVTLSKPNPDGILEPPIPLTASILYLTSVKEDIELSVTRPDFAGAVTLDAVVRDSNRNLILQATQPSPVVTDKLTLLTLIDSNSTPSDEPQLPPDFTAIETISGSVVLPPKTTIPEYATVFVQLVENALAGGLSMALTAEQTLLISEKKTTIPFSIERGIVDNQNDEDLVFKAWIEDRMGRKIFIQRAPIGFNGADIKYEIKLDPLKQGQDTQRGRNLPNGLMAQTLVQGEASFDPINGIPGEARLKITLKEDRGAFNNNPILSEQTLILRGMETRVPFSLTTDSTHFDPYTPTPFLTVSLTDKFGRVYYSSGDVRARESANNLRLFPR